jgi:hypothetical protein
MNKTDRKVIPLHASPASTVMDQFGRLLSEPDDVGPHSQLVPLEHIAVLEREMRAALRPAGSRDIKTVVSLILGSFKLDRALESPEVFMHGMAEELSEYPADVLFAVTRRARRSFRSLPSIAEVVELCEDEVRPRRQRLRTLERMQAEHDRRRRAAEEARRRIAMHAEPARRHQHRQAVAAALPHADAAGLPQADAGLPQGDEWQLAVQELRDGGASGDEIAAFTASLMDDNAALRAAAEARQGELAQAARRRIAGKGSGAQVASA